MTKKHAAVFDDVLAGLNVEMPGSDRSEVRFAVRQSRVAERFSGEIEEKVLRRIDPAHAHMWPHHNRAYGLLTEDNCRDLIDGIRAQGRQEFPAIVRETGDAAMPYEVVCGARRHFAISWLRANNYPQFRYLVEVRDLTDEEAFRLSDIENRDREDISDYERARDYDGALQRYYGGRQTDMAARLEVSDAWLSRYLALARLPDEIVAAFPSVRDIREAHARILKPHLGRKNDRTALLGEAQAIAREGRGLDAATVMRRLRSAVVPSKPRQAKEQVFRRRREESGMTLRRKGRTLSLEFSDGLSRDALKGAFDAFLRTQFETDLSNGKKKD